MGKSFFKIDNRETLDKLITDSNTKPVVIFKHSNACPISARAHEEVRRVVDGQIDRECGFGMVVVQEARPLSNAIEM